MGIPLFRMAAEMAGGGLEIVSEPGRGTCVTATFGLSSIDRMPLGDMAGTIAALIRLNPQMDFLYRRCQDGREEELDTRELRQVLGEVPLDQPDVMEWVNGALEEMESAVRSKQA